MYAVIVFLVIGYLYSIHFFASSKLQHHENNMDNSRASILINRAFSDIGDTGPIYFLLDVNKIRIVYTDGYFRRNGAAYGSTISMTKNGY